MRSLTLLWVFIKDCFPQGLCHLWIQFFFPGNFCRERCSTSTEIRSMSCKGHE